MFGRLFGKKKEEKTEDDVKLEQSLTKTRGGIFGRIGTIFQENEITDELWEELEETLIMGDVGMATAEELLQATRQRVAQENIKASSDAYLVLKQEMVRMLQSDEPLHIEEPRILTVVLVVYYAKAKVVPTEFQFMTPYVATLLVLVFASKRLRPPAAAGKPWRKGQGT
mgnify:CR=1 FL=1